MIKVISMTSIPKSILALLLISTPITLSCMTQRKDATSARQDTKQYPSFGRDMRSEFLLNENFILLDHGAYGTYPKATQAGLRTFQDRAEANPDLWMRREAEMEMVKVREQVAELINADAKDVVMIPNATSGMNAIFRSLLFKLGERILYFSTIYGSMGSIIQYIMDTNVEKNVSSLVFNVAYPISNDLLVSNLETFLEENHDPERPIRIALIDHITSVPGVIVPIERIIPLLRRYNIEVLIDGAHAIGQIPIDIQKLAPDYYITNCHKWLYASRGAAVMFVDPKYQGLIHPAHINSGYSVPGGFQSEFFWTGTMDYSPYMSVTAALQFRRDVGGEAAIQDYTHQLAIQGGAYLAERFGTEVMQNVTDQMGSMVDVRLPINNPQNSIIHTRGWWIDTLLYRFPSLYSSTYFHNGEWWTRNSVQIYNDMSDFEAAADVFLAICEEINSEDGPVTGVPITASTGPTSTSGPTTGNSNTGGGMSLKSASFSLAAAFVTYMA